MSRRSSEIIGLFTTPSDIQERERQRISQEAGMFTDPINRIAYQSAAGLAGGVGRLLGAQTPEMEQVTRIQDIQKSVDFDPNDLPTYYKTLTKRFINAGLTQAGAQAFKLSQDAEIAKSTGADKTAAMKNFESYQNLSPEQKLVWDRAQGRILTPNEKRAIAEAQAEGTVFGKARAEATLSLPEIEATIAETQSSIDFLLDDDNQSSVKRVVGANSIIIGVPGTEAFNAIRQYEQLKGQLSLSQYEKLKGAGQITEKELQVASDAITKLDRGLTYEAFIEELKKLRKILNLAKERAIQKTQVTSTKSQVTPTSTKPTLRYNPRTRTIEKISE
jgi:hypothetical protein